jgi:hypothetical protein
MELNSFSGCAVSLLFKLYWPSRKTKQKGKTNTTKRNSRWTLSFSTLTNGNFVS